MKENICELWYENIDKENKWNSERWKEIIQETLDNYYKHDWRRISRFISIDK